MDVVDVATRSRIMSSIRGGNTKPEILVRSLLHREGFRFRLHVRELAGKPDIVLPKYRAVVFVHGCFWHGHDCPLYRLPDTRTDFWRKKIDRNRAKDRSVRDVLLSAGWRVAVVWECALRGAGTDPGQVGRYLAAWLRSNEPEACIRK